MRLETRIYTYFDFGGRGRKTQLNAQNLWRVIICRWLTLSWNVRPQATWRSRDGQSKEESPGEQERTQANPIPSLSKASRPCFCKTFLSPEKARKCFIATDMCFEDQWKLFFNPVRLRGSPQGRWEQASQIRIQFQSSFCYFYRETLGQSGDKRSYKSPHKSLLYYGIQRKWELIY